MAALPLRPCRLALMRPATSSRPAPRASPAQAPSLACCTTLQLLPAQRLSPSAPGGAARWRRPRLCVVACSDGNGASAPKLERTSGGVTDSSSLAPPPNTAAAEYAVLAQFSSVRWYEMLAGCAYVLLMAEGLRFCVEAPAPLASKLAAGALVGLLFDFSQRAFLQTRGAQKAAAAGRQVLRFRLLCAMKIALELGGAALVSIKGLGAEGAAVALFGHLVFNLLNDQAVTFAGVVTPFPAQARKPLIVTDALLVVACVGASLARGPVVPVVFAGVFAAFAAVYLGAKFILNKSI